jgi:hypothetical protein
MAKKFLADREKALEELFFEKQNRELIERMQRERDQREAREGLKELSGIQDESILDKLAELEIRPGTWAALALIPLVEVAWADGRVSEKERRAVLSAAEANGIAKGSAAHELLESWLGARPDPRFLEAWGAYIVEICSNLSAAERSALESEILERAIQVGKAEGGILGLGSKLSDSERTVIDELRKAFRAQPSPA